MITIDDIFESAFVSATERRVSYALNNEQPVRCSYIGTQPLFYMDFEGDLDDVEDDDNMLFDFTAIEQGVETLASRLSYASRPSDSEYEKTEEACLDLFARNIAVATGKEKTCSQDIAGLTALLRKSRLAAAFLDFAADNGTKLVYDPQTESACYDRQTNDIYINPALSQTDCLLLAARELRRVWQHRQGALINPLTFHPDQAILVHRAQIADLQVMMVRIAWELQLSGEKQAWERVEHSSLADLARAFARESYTDFRTLNNGAAQSAVFEAWFLSERCRSEDRVLINQMLADYHGYVFDAAQSSEKIAADLVVALGEMPFGKNYLAPYVQTIISDPIFTEVRDRSNANFLWFIKFERTFRETEQELQNVKSVPGGNDQNAVDQNKNKRFGKNEEETIITLPAGGEDCAPLSPLTGANGKSGSANIIPFRRQSGNKR